MASRKIKTIAVDEKFFNNIFEMKRKEFQKELGVMNLSQANFTKMIKGFKLIKPKKPISEFKPKRRKRDELFKI